MLGASAQVVNSKLEITLLGTPREVFTQVSIFSFQYSPNVVKHKMTLKKKNSLNP